MARFLADHSSDVLFVNGSLESLLPSTSCARSIWNALQAFDFAPFEAAYENEVMGRPAIAPRSLAAVWILGMLRGITSSVALAEYCARDIEFRWLLGDVSVKKSTLCEFRTGHQQALGNLSTQVLAALGRSHQLPAKDLVLDGTIVRAAASCGASASRVGLQKRIGKLKELITQTLRETDGEAAREVDVLARRQQRLEACLVEMDRMGLMADDARLTLSEPQASTKKLKHGGFAPAHNVQVVSDAASGAIITANVIKEAVDQGQLLAQTTAAQHALAAAAELNQTRPAPMETITADGAYHQGAHLATLDAQGIQAAVPNREDRRGPGVTDAYLRNAFTHEQSTDSMRCPMGQPLPRFGFEKSRNLTKYRAPAAVCNACPAKKQCCPGSTAGRSISRPLHAPTIEKTEQFLATEKGQRLRHARSTTSEGNFARLLGLLHWPRCRTWGRAGAQAEATWRQLTHNLMLLTGMWRPLVLTPQTSQ